MSLSSIQTLDFQILDAIQDLFRCPFLDAVMPVLTALGNGGALWIVLAVLFFFHAKTRKISLALTIGLFAHLFLVNLLMKPLIARPRPCWIRNTADLLIAVPDDFSFPSGHTGASFLAAVILLHYDKRIGIPALLLACVIAFSRLYLYVHFPTDILGGLVIGILLGLFSVFLTERLSASFSSRKTAA